MVSRRSALASKVILSSWVAHVRTSLLEPIPELELAAKLLDAAADAVLQQRLDLAARLLSNANFQEIRDYAWRLVGKMSPEVHHLTKRPKCLPKAERDPRRMPSQTEQREIFLRDGWRCRFCGIKVINRRARSVLVHLFSIESCWTSKERQRHAALYALAASLDHVLPHGRGGKNELPNFVTACYCCQFGRGEWLLDEVGVQDPLLREPVRDSWDGLTRIVEAQPNN